MEGTDNEHGRPGQGKERCLTDIDCATTSASTVVGPARSAATVMEDAVNATTPTLKPPKFDVDAAEGLVQNHDYQGLEEYVLEFLTKVQGNSFYPHPGILCSIYQAEIAHLIRVERFVEAEKVFSDKVKPLLNHNASTDELFRPADLEDRVKMVQSCVNNRKPPNQDENIFGLLCDYLLLYFPSCMPGDRERKGSVSDFLVAIHNDNDDEKRERRRRRCLACQWVMPASTTAGEITKHFRSSGKHVECCFRVTKWMVQYLDSLKREPSSTEIQGDVAVKVKPQPKKRKASSMFRNYFTVTPAIFDQLKGINLAMFLAAVAVSEENPDSGAVSKGRGILWQQSKLVSELVDLFFSSMVENAPPDYSLAAMKIISLGQLSDGLFLLRMDLPSASGELADLCVRIIDLKKSFIFIDADDMAAAGTAIARTLSTSSTGSNTPFEGTLGTDVPGPF